MGKADKEEDKGAIELGVKKADNDKPEAPEDIPWEKKGKLVTGLSPSA